MPLREKLHDYLLPLLGVVLVNAPRKARHLVAGWELRLLLKVALELDGWRRLLIRHDPRPRRDGHAHLFVTLVVPVGLFLGVWNERRAQPVIALEVRQFCAWQERHGLVEGCVVVPATQAAEHHPARKAAQLVAVVAAERVRVLVDLDRDYLVRHGHSFHHGHGPTVIDGAHCQPHRWIDGLALFEHARRQVRVRVDGVDVCPAILLPPRLHSLGPDRMPVRFV